MDMSTLETREKKKTIDVVKESCLKFKVLFFCFFFWLKNYISLEPAIYLAN